MKKIMNLLMLALLLLNNSLIALPNVSAERLEDESIIKDIYLLSEEGEVINEEYVFTNEPTIQLVIDLELNQHSLKEELLLPKELLIDEEQSGNILLESGKSKVKFTTIGQKIELYPENLKEQTKGELRINISLNPELIDNQNKITFTLPLVNKSFEFTQVIESQILKANVSEKTTEKNQANLNDFKIIQPENVNMNLLMERDGELVHIIKDNVASNVKPWKGQEFKFRIDWGLSDTYYQQV